MGRRTRPRHLGMESSPAAEGRGEAAAVRRRPLPVPVHRSCGSRRGWCPPGAGGLGGRVLSWWVGGFPCHKGWARARLLNVQLSQDSWMTYE